MGKFDGVLFFADYDDTLYNSAHTVSPENRAAIRYFMENGGYFSIATVHRGGHLRLRLGPLSAEQCAAQGGPRRAGPAVRGVSRPGV